MRVRRFEKGVAEGKTEGVGEEREARGKRRRLRGRAKGMQGGRLREAMEGN